MKGVVYEQVTHDLRRGAQRDPAFLRLQPQGLVSALDVDGATLLQSPRSRGFARWHRQLPAFAAAHPSVQPDAD